MNRRNFFKVVTGFTAGVYAAFIPNSKSIGASNGLAHLEGEKVDILKCGGQNGTLCPRCKSNDCHWPNYCKLNQLRIESAQKKDGGAIYFTKGTQNISETIVIDDCRIVG